MAGQCKHMNCVCAAFQVPTSKWGKRHICKRCMHSKKEHQALVVNASHELKEAITYNVHPSDTYNNNNNQNNNFNQQQQQMMVNNSDESIVKQLQIFGYQRDKIIVAMQCVTNPTDINEIVEWLEKRAANGPQKHYNNSPQQYSSSSYQSSYIQQQKAAEQEKLRQERLRQQRLRQQKEEEERQERLRMQRLRQQQEQERLRQQRLHEQQQQQNRALVPYGGKVQLANDDNDNDDDDDDDDDCKEVDDFMSILQAMVGLAVVEQHGFILATEKHRIALIRALAMVQCNGCTALRDAILTGVVLLLQLKGVLLELGSIKHKFIHIVLTDGADTSSESSLDDLKILFFKLGMEIGDLCKTFFVGIGLGWKEKKELDDIARLAGDCAESLNCNDVDLERVFERIELNLGIRRQIVAVESGGIAMIAAKDELVAEVTKNKYLVLFTLDISGSMDGARWEKVVRAVAGFCVGMNDDDILGCILFNDKAELITK